jgi:hypothetical protein
MAPLFEGLEAAVRERPELELIAALAGRVDEVRATLDQDRNAELAEQLERIEAELRAGLPPVGVAVGAHAQQLEWLSGNMVRLDEELAARLEQLLERVGGVESVVRDRTVELAVTALGDRVEELRVGLDEPRDVEVRRQLDRLETVLHELPIATQAAASEQRTALSGVTETVAQLELTLAERMDEERLARLEELAEALHTALADPPGTASLSRLVAQSHNALADRISTFEETLAGDAVVTVTPSPVVELPMPSPSDSRREPASFVALVPSPEGYRLAVLDGLLPEPGDTVLVEGAERVVARHGRSPLPGDRRRCAFLEAA